MMRVSKRTAYLAVAGIVLLVALGVIITYRQQASRRHALEQAWQNFSQTRSLHTIIQLQLHLSPQLNGKSRPFPIIQARLEGDAQHQAEATWEFNGRLYAETRGQGNILYTNADIRILPDTTIFRLDSLPALITSSQKLIHKWTYIDAPLLATNNGTDISQVLASFANSFSYDRTEGDQGHTLYHYTGHLGDDQKKNIARVFQQSASGNQGLHVIARLLAAGDVKLLEAWVDKQSGQLRQLRLQLVRSTDGQESPLASLKLTFTDFGKTVAIDRPAQELRVEPAVFVKIFGNGEIQGLE